MVSDSFLDMNPDCWMQTEEGRLRPASGLCFGSRFLGENGKRLFEILPGSMFKRVRNQTSFWLAWLIDVCAEHVDNRQAIFVEDAEGWLDAHFIDHGHLFGGPKADLKRNFGASRYLDQRIYGQVSSEALLSFQDVLQALDADKLWQRIEAIPAEWSHASAREGFERCLQRLKIPSLVQHVVETIISDLERRAETESGIVGSERKPPSEKFCALAYRAQDFGGATPVILIVLEDAKGGLRFLVDPGWRAVVRAEDVEYIESLLGDFLERAKEQPATLFEPALFTRGRTAGDP